MILGRDHWFDCFGIGKSQYRNLRTGQKLFNDDVTAAFTENFIFHHGANCLLCLRKILRNDHAFSQCQTVRFNNRRIDVFGADIVNCLVRVVEHLILSSRNMVFFH